MLCSPLELALTDVQMPLVLLLCSREHSHTPGLRDHNAQIRCTGVANAYFGTKFAAQVSQMLKSAAQVSQIRCTGVANAYFGTKSAAQVSQMLMLAPNPLHRCRKC